MYSTNKTESTIEPRTVKDVVCPECFYPLPYPSMAETRTDKEGRNIRTYLGWCFKCHQGFAVIQFEHCSRWCIHKYQKYHSAGGVDSGVIEPDAGGFKELCPLPAAPVIMTGPGGDYVETITPEQLTNSIDTLLDKISSILTAAGCAIKKLRDAFDDPNDSDIAGGS